MWFDGYYNKVLALISDANPNILFYKQVWNMTEITLFRKRALMIIHYRLSLGKESKVVLMDVKQLVSGRVWPKGLHKVTEKRQIRNFSFNCNQHNAILVQHRNKNIAGNEHNGSPLSTGLNLMAKSRKQMCPKLRLAIKWNRNAELPRTLPLRSWNKSMWSNSL